MGRKEPIEGTEERQQVSCLGFDIIDIASPEELFEHDGPLLAEDSDWYHYRRYACHEQKEAAAPRREKVTDGVQEHVKRVMEQAKVRKVHERSAIASSTELMKETMRSLQAAQDRMEFRARASAALEAAAKRAAAAKDAPEVVSEKESSKAPAQHHPIAKKPPTAPGPVSRAPADSRRPKPQAAESLQDRISRILAEAQRRNQDAQTNHTTENIELWEQTTTASSISATDSGSDSGAEWQPSMFWGQMPR
jgi:hypothetical protein|mmetsp:Transcript_77415/g.122250  ORF Transcript_77415/g.122250 Transcript_77415/m.122250 type:complete len:250 (-) Transcript_77415:143-892(-)